METKIKFIKKFRSTPLSKVYLINIANKKYIKKIIHADFVKEFYKQKYLSNKCKIIKIPKIHNINIKNGKAISLMEFIPHEKNKLKLTEVLSTISMFHKETENVRSNIFAIYNFDSFHADFLNAKKYLPCGFKNMTKKQLREFFAEVFNSKYAVVHGDFHEDQILKNKKYCLIDFASSFYGPKILDYAYIFRYDRKIKKQVLNYLNEGRKSSNGKLSLKFLKALIVIFVYDIAWFINRRRYERKSFTKQILKDKLAINRTMDKITNVMRIKTFSNLHN